MTENFYTEIYKDSTRFGGLIYDCDFETDYRRDNTKNGSDIAARILADRRFDERCRKNIEQREKAKAYKEQNK